MAASLAGDLINAHILRSSGLAQVYALDTKRLSLVSVGWINQDYNRTVPRATIHHRGFDLHHQVLLHLFGWSVLNTARTHCGPSLQEGQTCLPFFLFGFLTPSSGTTLYRRWVPRLTTDNFTCCNTHETERGDHDFCLGWSHYTDTDPTSREPAATQGIEPRTSSPGVVGSTDCATPPPQKKKKKNCLQYWV